MADYSTTTFISVFLSAGQALYTLENWPVSSSFSGVSGRTSPSTEGANHRGNEKNI
jgi:hypothetical protein